MSTSPKTQECAVERQQLELPFDPPLPPCSRATVEPLPCLDALANLPPLSDEAKALLERLAPLGDY